MRKRATTLDADEPLAVQFGSIFDPQALTLEQEIQETRQVWIDMHVKLGKEPPKMEPMPEGPPTLDEEFKKLGAELSNPLEYMEGFVKYIFFHRFYEIKIESLTEEEMKEYQRTQSAYTHFKNFLVNQSAKLQMDIHTQAIQTKNKQWITILAYLAECPNALIVAGGTQGRLDLCSHQTAKTGAWCASLKSPAWCVSASLDKKHATFLACVHCFYHMERYVQVVLDTLVKHHSSARETWEYVMGPDTGIPASGWNYQKIDLLIRLRAIVEIVQGWC